MFAEIPMGRTAAAAICALAAVSCTTYSYQRRQDREVYERVRAAHQQAANNPGNGRAAMSYSDAVIRGWRSGAFNRCLRRIEAAKDNDGDDGEVSGQKSCDLDPKNQLREAARLLEEAADVQRGDAPTLIAQKGLMYCSADRTDTCLSELQRSMSMGPNVLAGTGLATWHGNHDNYRKVREVCRKTLPHLQGNDTRYEFMKMCLNQSGATSTRSGLSWAPKSDRQFYLQERQRRRRASQRRQQQKQRRERRIKKCVANCKERGHLCMRDCHTEQCETSCNKAYQACLDECETL